MPGKDDVYGYIFIDTENENVQFVQKLRSDPDGGVAQTKTFFDWEEHLNAEGYVLSPLIDRGGACVMVDIGTADKPNEVVGCMLQDPQTGTQFSQDDGTYQVLVKSDNSAAQIFFKDALRSLLAVGTVMYLRMEVIQDARFKITSQANKWLYTRLNVPNVAEPVQGKIYVTAVCRKNRTRLQNASVTGVTFAVNPWDLVPKHLFKGGLDNIAKHLE